MPYIRQKDLAEREISNCCSSKELAELLNITVGTLRRYEDIRVLKPEKITIGKRDFYYCGEKYIDFLKERIQKYKTKKIRRIKQ